MTLEWYSKKRLNKGRAFVSVSSTFLRFSSTAAELFKPNTHVDLAIDDTGRLAISPSPLGRFKILDEVHGRVISCSLFIQDTELLKKYYLDEQVEEDGRTIIFMKGEGK